MSRFWIISFAIILFVTFFTVYIAIKYNKQNNGSVAFTYFGLIAGIILFCLFIVFIIYFLSSSKREFNKIDEVLLMGNVSKRVRHEVERQFQFAASNNPNFLTLETALVENVKARIEKEFVSKYANQLNKDNHLKSVILASSPELDLVVGNIKNYLVQIERNSIINLVIGIIATISGISFLAYSIVSLNNNLDMSKFFILFLPRFSFVLIIQVFAFFFLRLYKNNLEDAKYFQNELTNLSSRNSALKTAILTDNQPIIEEILKEFAKTERNFKILKDETLLFLERAKIEKELDTLHINSLSWK